MFTKKGSSPPTIASLTGEKIFLRPASADDIANAHFWFTMSDPHSQTCRPLKLKSAGEAVEAFKKKADNPNRQTFAIVDIDSKTLLGKIAYFDYNPLNRSAEFGILIDPDQRQKGIASDALKTLVTYLFKFRGLNKVYAQTGEFNAGAIKLMESLGFKRDATLRDHYYYDGNFHKGYIYSLLLFELDW